ncbi:MAG TPA: hypothetical protein VKH44_02845, partial [Pirellulaceae bacterium]|nr:hypothetical protein [Pirellulaceae bacterium]
CLPLGIPAAYGWESPAAEAATQISFPLDLAIIDPDAKEKRPPYIVMFGGGVDKDGTDVRGPLGRLEALRGASKMFPESNQDPGLPVVLRGLRFHRKLNSDGGLAGYEVELQGEFNTVRVPASQEDVKTFLSGQRTTFVLAAEKNFGIYAYVSSMKLDVQLQGKDIFIFNIDGDFTFREGFSTYASQTKKLSPPTSRSYLYRGERADLPVLPSI